MKVCLNEQKHILIQQTDEKFLAELQKNVETINKVETILVYEDLFNQKAEKSTILVDMYYEIKQCYRAILLCLIEQKVKFDQEVKMQTRQIINPKLSKEQDKFYSFYNSIANKMDFFGAYLVFKDFMDIRTIAYFDYKKSEIKDLTKLVNQFGNNIFDSLKDLENMLSARLRDIENAGVLNDNNLYISNNLDSSYDNLKKFEEFYRFLNLIVLCQHNYANFYVTRNFFKYLIINNFFYAVETQVKLKNEFNCIEFEKKIKDVKRNIKKAEELRMIIVCLLNNIFELKNRFIFEKKRKQAILNELKIFYDESLFSFNKTLIRKTNSAEHSREVIVKGVKYLIRNCPEYIKFFELASKNSEFHMNNKEFHKQKKLLKVYFKSKNLNKQKKSKTETKGKKKSFNEKEFTEDNVNEGESTQKETSNKRKVSEHKNLDHLIKRVGNLIQKKEEDRTFKVSDQKDYLYDDEYDDTLDVYTTRRATYNNNNNININNKEEENLYNKEELSSSEEENAVKKEINPRRQNQNNRRNKRKNNKESGFKKKDTAQEEYHKYQGGTQRDFEDDKEKDEPSRHNYKSNNYNKNKKKK